MSGVRARDFPACQPPRGKPDFWTLAGNCYLNASHIMSSRSTGFVSGATNPRPRSMANKLWPVLPFVFSSRSAVLVVCFSTFLLVFFFGLPLQLQMQFAWLNSIGRLKVALKCTCHDNNCSLWKSSRRSTLQ